MLTKNALLVVTLFFICTLSAGAYEFQPLGFESIGMGGAGVASARGPMAGYYNPALLTKETYTFEFNLGGGASMRENNLADNIDQLSKLELTDTVERIRDGLSLNPSMPFTAITDQDRENVVKAKGVLTNLSTGNSFSLMPSVSVGARINHFALGVFATSDVAAEAVVSGSNTELIFKNTQSISGMGSDVTVYYAYNPGVPGDVSQPQQYTFSVYDQNGAAIDPTSIPGFSTPAGCTYDETLTPTQYEKASLQYAVTDAKSTNLRLQGIALTEIPISYAGRVKTPVGTLSLGASAKAMQGITYGQTIDVDTDTDELADRFDDDKMTSTAFGVDAGVLFQPYVMKHLTLGVVGKNLNSPQFKTANAAENFMVDPMYRAGAAYGLFNDHLDLAVDYDLSKNDTAFGYKAQYLGGGINLHPSSWLSIRAGAMSNMADDTEGIIYTGGFGIGLKWVQFDVSAEASSKTGIYDGNEVPSYAKVNAALISRW